MINLNLLSHGLSDTFVIRYEYKKRRRYLYHYETVDQRALWTINVDKAKFFNKEEDALKFIQTFLKHRKEVSILQIG